MFHVLWLSVSYFSSRAVAGAGADDFVPLIERQVVTLINTFPQMHDWVVNTVIPWVEQKTGSQLRTWLDPEQMIQWMHSNWEQAGAWPGGFSVMCRALVSSW